MSYVKSLKPKSKLEEKIIGNPLDIISNPIRSRILIELLLYGETTGKKLENITNKARSTLSYHLKKLIESRLLEVHISTGKEKKYHLHPNFIKGYHYELDEKEFLKLPLEESRQFLFDLLNASMILGQSFANFTQSTIKKIFSYPENVSIVSITDKKSIFHFLERSYDFPHLIFAPLTQEVAEYISERMDGITQEIKEKFNYNFEIPKSNSNESIYLLSFSLFPLILTNSQYSE